MNEIIENKIATFFGALNHPTRIKILELLEKKPMMCVCEIVASLKKEQSNISRHLNALKIAKIVEFETKGTRTFYRIKDKTIFSILENVKSILLKEIKEEQKLLAKV